MRKFVGIYRHLRKKERTYSQGRNRNMAARNNSGPTNSALTLARIRSATQIKRTDDQVEQSVDAEIHHWKVVK